MLQVDHDSTVDLSGLEVGEHLVDIRQLCFVDVRTHLSFERLIEGGRRYGCHQHAMRSAAGLLYDLCGSVRCPGIDDDVRPKLRGQGKLLFSDIQCRDVQAHGLGVLDGDMAT